METRQSKRALAKQPAADQKNYVAKKRAKELERVLLPDAPPCKRTRKQTSGETPSVPSPPKPQYTQQHEADKHAVAGVLSEHDQLTEDLQGTSGCASDTNPDPLMCDWSTGELPSPHLRTPAVAARTGCSKPAATVTSADVGNTLSPPDSQHSAPSSQSLLSYVELVPSKTSQTESQDVTENDDENDEEFLQWLEDTSDEEPSDIDPDYQQIIECSINFAGEEPAVFPEDSDPELGQWLTNQDLLSDKTMTAMLSDDSMTFEWSSNPDTFLGQREDFTGNSGPTFPIHESTRPIDIFLRYFDDEIFNIIVSETNRNIASSQQPLQKNSPVRKFTETDKNEVAVFIAMLIFQSISPLPEDQDYFLENGYLTVPYFKALITYNRFTVLKRFLHFTDDSTTTKNMTTNQIKLQKLGPLLDLLNNKFSTLYLPSRDIAIDEALLHLRSASSMATARHGHLPFAQRIATKAAKVGVKSYELCESRTGYLWKFLVHTGKTMTHGQTDDNRQTDRDDRQVPQNITARIVDDLVKPLLNRGHTLTMDSFYNSPLLARYLKMNKTDSFGTLRVDRQHVPLSIKSMAKSGMQAGEVVHSYCRDLSVLLWRDNNLVSMISTFHRGDVGGKEKHGIYNYKPQAVLDYNLTVEGVDKKEQLLSSYPMERNGNQIWSKKVFRRLLNVTILNAYIVFKTRFPNVTHVQFRQKLANELVGTFKTPPIDFPRLKEMEELKINTLSNAQRPNLIGNHFFGLGQSEYKTCVWCKKARTKYICKQCDVSLCLLTCFEDFHS